MRVCAHVHVRAYPAGEGGSGPCRPGPPSTNWKRRLSSQRRRPNQRPLKLKGPLLD